MRPSRHHKHPDNPAALPDTEHQTLEKLSGQLPGYAYRPAEALEDIAARQEAADHKRLRRRKIKRIILSLLIVLLLIGGWPAYKFISNQIKVFGADGLVSLLKPVKLKGENRGYVNILLAGNSSDDPGHSGANLTDSIMLLSINPSNKTAFMLSMPRDLYVNIPDNGYAKINEAYQDGESDHFSEGGYALGGMGLLEKTVSASLGVPIDYYALVNYNAVRDAVNALGGITVTITSNDPRGLYDPSPDLANNLAPLVKLANGQQTLNGVQALGLARARGNAYGAYGFASSDFARTEHQRLLLLGIKDKAATANTLVNPVKLGKLFDTFGNNVKTDLSLGEARRLYSLTKQIPNSKITSAGLNDADGKNLLMSYRTRTGQSALVPAAGVDDYSAVQAYVQKLLTPPASSTTPSTSN